MRDMDDFCSGMILTYSVLDITVYITVSLYGNLLWRANAAAQT
jgi:hypothetical protein